GAKLVALAPLMPGVTQQWPFNYHVVASADINAFALPGGSIFINLGTIQVAQTEAQLVGVMAHETSHVVMRHSTCNLTAQQRRSVLYGLGSIASAVLLGNGAAGSLAQGAIGLGQNLDYLHMSRGDEQQADLLGTDLLYKDGYDPRGLPQFFEIIEAKYGQGGAQMLSDHPNPGNRTQYVDAEIATLDRRPDWVVTSPEFQSIHALAVKEKVYTAQEIQNGAWKSAGIYARSAGQTTAAAEAAPVLQRLTRAQMATGGVLRRLDTGSFSLQYPAAWQVSGDTKAGSVSLAPPGGAVNGAIGYGATLDMVTVPGGVAGDAALRTATLRLVQQLVNDNPGLARSGDPQRTKVGGQPAYTVMLHGRSPVANANQPLDEQDQLVAVQRPDGNLSYLILTSPAEDAAAMQPAFRSMVRSFVPR
ncbi:MAG: M48 family metalloprotease, partial [Acidobacteriota bacterium]|nr:M48 family metalloprotease [Acidobacteriota bacterium]